MHACHEQFASGDEFAKSVLPRIFSNSSFIYADAIFMAVVVFIAFVLIAGRKANDRLVRFGVMSHRCIDADGLMILLDTFNRPVPATIPQQSYYGTNTTEFSTLRCKTTSCNCVIS